MRVDVDLGGGYRLLRPNDGAPRVVAPGGEVLSGDAQTFDRAIGIMDRHKAAVQRKVRRCLCCGREFLSAHVGNRMCKGCRHKPEGMV